jgi:hypothetical protein
MIVAYRHRTTSSVEHTQSPQYRYSSQEQGRSWAPWRRSTGNSQAIGSQVRTQTNRSQTHDNPLKTRQLRRQQTKCILALCTRDVLNSSLQLSRLISNGEYIKHHSKKRLNELCHWKIPPPTFELHRVCCFKNAGLCSWVLAVYHCGDISVQVNRVKAHKPLWLQARREDSAEAQIVCACSQACGYSHKKTTRKFPLKPAVVQTLD